MKSIPRSLLSGAVSSLLGISATSLAQNAPTRASSVLEEVVVTAQKRSESLQDVPLAVSAFTDATRDLVGITTISDITDFTPGLTYSLTQDRISLRGVGRLSNNYGSDPGVATYSDGFYTASTVEAGKRPIIVDRVEVLRGPQGTLYGRNSIGGAINVVSKRPTDTLQGELGATVGNYETTYYDVSLSGPLTDWLRFRVAGYYGGHDKGYFQDIDGDSSEGSLRQDDTYTEGQLEFDLGDSVDGWFKYATSTWDQSRRTLANISPRDFAPLYFNGVTRTVPPGAPSFTPAALNPNVLYNGGIPNQPLLSAPYLDPNPALADRRLYDTDREMQVNLDDVDIFVLELVWHAGLADLKYLGGYQGYTYQQFSDFDNTDRVSYTTLGFNPLLPFNPGVNPGPYTFSTQLESFYQEDKEYYSNELNLISTGDGPLQWIVGLYQFHEQVYQFQGYRAPFQEELSHPLLLAPFGAPGPENPQRNYSRAGANLDADARAVFAQIDWSFAERWKTTLGVRYTEDNKDADEFRTRVFFGVPAGTLGLPAALPGIPLAFYVPGELDRSNHLAGKWNATTGTAGLEWTPNDDTLAFAKYTRGYKSGGFNAGEFSDDTESYTDPEHVNSYELGLKQTLFDALTANVSIFYYDYTNPQVPLSVLDPATQISSSPFFNIEKAVSMGAELETVWAVTDALQLRVNYSYLDTEIKDDTLCVADTADRLALDPDAQPCSGVVGGRVFQSLDGNKLPSSPEHKIAANANYTWTLPAGSFTLSGTWTYRDEAYYDLFTRDYNKTPAYDETDLRALWTDAKDRYTIIGFVRNAFDDEGYERANASQSFWGVQSRELALTEPRTYGVEVQFRFGS